MEPPSSSSCTKADDPAELRRRPLHVNVAREKLELEDLSLTCRRDRYCVMCVRAFCSHCCAPHHVLPLGYHIVVPIDAADAATGKPVVPDHYPGRWRQEPITDFAVGLISAAGDYAEALPRDGYCIYCLRAFSTASCPHHQHCCPPGCFVRIVERDGRRCVRCTGDEPWFPFMESILGDPVAVEDDGHGDAVLFLPLISRTSPTACVQCAGEVADATRGSLCSPACDEAHEREVAQRKERRDAMLAARRLAKLRIDAV